eukprot:TRINITY_DN8612_c0_g1_i2.p1 TRINITY_DN8612_c0_g1~~TRINITY_DN8612_c0_g1_i2.p1  ORF type:complete len:705 (-),score=189.30 TRINITY_DN8612_c0_g1_i2:34-2148(-)
MASFKKKLQASLGSEITTKVDDAIIDYICGVLEDVSLLSDVDECSAVISPLLLDSGCSDEETQEACQRIVRDLGSSGKASATPTVESRKILAAPIKLGDQINAPTPDTPGFEFMKKDAKPTYVDTTKAQNDAAKRERRLAVRQKKDEHKKKQSDEKAGLPTQEFVVSHNKEDRNKPKDIKLDNFTISYGKNVLLEDCSVTLAYSRRYGLVGRNGSGKTTLLSHLATRQLDGIPGHLRILHVEQEVAGDETSVLNCVLASDRERHQLLLEEQKLLSEGLDSKSLLLERIYNRLNEIDAHSAPARAAQILAGLGFETHEQNQPTRLFSGGWRMRVALARALFCQPDILLLDEPTNHLDLFSCLWLERYLTESWSGTVLIVSHQRDFLNAVVTDILHLHNRKIDHYKGNFDAFENVRYDRMLQQQRQFDAQQKRIKHVQQFIDRFRYNANRANLVQSRLKALEKMVMVEQLHDDPTLVLRFPDPEQLTPPILQFRDVTFSYDKDSKPLFKNVNVGIDLDSRVALVGANGTGKSTLLQLMAGELEPTTGYILRHSKLKFAKFSQHFVDQLHDLSISPLEHFMNTYSGVQMQTARSHLGSFGLSGDIALRGISTLSGGQKSRLVFALLSWKNPHVLLLDEPTNHLDIETIDSLCQALATFKGGVLLVSHDERLISVVCDQLWYLKNNEVHIYDGEFTEYRKLLMSEIQM